MEPRAELRAPMPRGTARRPFVACVDDEPEMLHTYGRLLRDEPVELLTFQDPTRVLAWVERAPLDVVLADERMPGMSGTELLKEVGRRSPRTRLALVTAYPDPEVVSRRTEVPIPRIFTKPFIPEDLKGSIRRLLRENIGLSPGSECAPQRLGRIELAPANGGPRGLRAIIDLSGASLDAVLEQFLPLAIWAHASGERPVVCLRNSDRLAGPLPALIEALGRTLERLDARVSLWDESGQVAQLLRSSRTPIRSSLP